MRLNLKCSLFYLGRTSCLCELHFSTDSYVMQRTDQNAYRKREPLKRRRLKLGTVPTIFPNCPSHMTTAALTRQTEVSAEDRHARTEARFIEQEELMWNHESIQSLADLKSKLQACESLPEGVSVIDLPGELLLAFVETITVPIITASLVVKSDMTWSAAVRQVPLMPSRLNVLPSNICNVSSVTNALAILKSLVEQESIHEVVETVQRNLKYIGDMVATDSERCTIQFISEQISLS